MVEHQPSKLDTWVRFPSPAFLLPFFMKGDMLAFTAMISWGFYSATIKKIGEWDYPDGSGDQENLFLRNVIPDSGSDVARGVMGCDSI